MPQFTQKCKLFSLLKNCRRITLTKGLLVSALVVYFIFGLHHLADFISADEHFWLPNSGVERIADYWKAIEKGEWKKTRINDKPGITLAYTSGIAELFIQNPKSQMIKNSNTVKIFNPAITKEINFAYRLPILLLSGFFSFFFFWIIKKITGDEWIALLSASGILLSPILLGMSQIVNPDSLFWIFGASSLFSFYSYLQKGERKMAILASLFLGLGLASKYVSVIFFPFFLFMMIAFYFLEYEQWKNDPKQFRKIIIKNSLAYLAILAGGMLLFALMMPASFVDPKYFYEGTIGFPGMKPIFWTAMAINALMILDALAFSSRILSFVFKKLSVLRKILPKLTYFILAGSIVFVLINWLSKQGLVNFSDVPFDAKQKHFFSHLPYLKRYIAELVPLVFALTPVALFSLLFLWIKGLFQKLKHGTLVFILSVFYLIFYAAVIQEGLLVTVRYSIILFPLSMVLVAIALMEFFYQDYSDRKNKLAVLIFSVISLTVFSLKIISLLPLYVFNGNLNLPFTTLAYVDRLAMPAGILGGIILTAIIYKFFPWHKIKNISRVWIFASLLVLSVLSIYLISPFYFSYTNELLPKDYIISGAWGYGGYEAAQYLNDLPGAKNLTVWADVYGVCEFFVGKCIHKAKVDTSEYTIDYYFQSLQATIPLNFPHKIEKPSIWSRYIDSRPESFLRISKSGPLASRSVSISSEDSTSNITGNVNQK